MIQKGLEYNKRIDNLAKLIMTKVARLSKFNKCSADIVFQDLDYALARPEEIK